MALNIFYDKDADLGRLAGKTVAVDRLRQPGPRPRPEPARSGVDVIVGLRKDSPSWAKAETAGLRVVDAGARRRARPTS